MRSTLTGLGDRQPAIAFLHILPVLALLLGTDLCTSIYTLSFIAIRAISTITLSDGAGSPKDKRSGDKRKLKKSDSGEKRKLKTRKSSKNKEREGSLGQSSTTAFKAEAASFREEDGQSLAFDSSEDVQPLDRHDDSEDSSLATSTTNIRGLAKTDYAATPTGRGSYHSQMATSDSMKPKQRQMDGAQERERQEDMESLSQQFSAADSYRRPQRSFPSRTTQGSDDSEDDEVSWSRTAQTTNARQRHSANFYDGLSSAHSSDSESVLRRQYLKPRPATDRKPMKPGDTSPNGTFRATSSDDRIKINVGGRIFETYVSTLRKYPHTLLGTMLHPRNAHMLGGRGKVGPDGKPAPDLELFFDRNPRMFEVVLDFYRTSSIHRPPDISWEMLQEELSFFQIDLPEYTNLSKRVSVELRKLEYKDLILPASEYRKMMRVKLLKEHHASIVRILDFIQQKIQRKADAGHNNSTITFYSPLHYTNSTPREIFKVISTNEVRELLVELLRTKDFVVRETNEYSKTKTTSIIGLHDQIINYNDPQYFSFHIKW